MNTNSAKKIAAMKAAVSAFKENASDIAAKKILYDLSILVDVDFKIKIGGVLKYNKIFPHTIAKIIDILDARSSEQSDDLESIFQIYEIALKAKDKFSLTRSKYTRDIYLDMIVYIERLYEIYNNSIAAIQMMQSTNSFSPRELPREDSEEHVWNWSMPCILSFKNLVKEAEWVATHIGNNETSYRFVIDENGIITFGFDNPNTTNIAKFTQLGIPCNINQRVDRRYLVYSDTYNGVVGVSSHASLNNYKPVIAAGKVLYNVSQKSITKINAYSGHYQPTAESVSYAKTLFEILYCEGNKIDFVKSNISDQW